MSTPTVAVTITLGWLLAQSQLGLKYLEGPDPDQVVVRWAHAVELVDPTPWLEGGEIVLTTGLRLPRSVAAQTAYLRRLHEAGVAALGFGIGLEYNEVPATVRRVCAEIGLPLVVVPLPTPFLAIIRAVADRRAEQRQAELQEAVAFQRRLTSVAVKQGVAGVVEALADKLDMPVGVFDSFGDEVASARTHPEFTSRARTELRLTAATATRAVPVGESHTLMLHHLTDESYRRGWLAVETARTTTNQTRLLIGQVASMLTLQMTRSAEVSALYADLGSVAAELAFAASPPADLNALARFGLSGAEGLRVVVVTSKHDRPVHTRELSAVLDEIQQPHVYTTRPGHVLALLRGDVTDAVIGQLGQRLANTGRSDLVVGASRPQPLHRLRAGHAEAIQAATSARIGNRSVGTYDSLELETLLDDDDLRRRVNDLAGTGLARLLQSGEPGDRELVKTLRFFLESNGSWEGASRKLGIHRHTMRQRVARIAGETGLDLDSAHTRAATLLILLAQDRDSA